MANPNTAYGTTIPILAVSVTQPAGVITAPSSTSTTTMAGLGASITPNFSGRIEVTLDCHLVAETATTVDNGILLQFAYGTGNPPGSNGTLTGTVAGVIRKYTHSVAPTNVGDVNYPISMSAFISGLSPGTTYWVDVQQLAVTTASEVSMSTVQVICRECL